MSRPSRASPGGLPSSSPSEAQHEHVRNRPPRIDDRLGSPALDRRVHVGALGAVVPAYFTWQALAICLVFHWLVGGLGICLTYHRLLTHRSFATRPKGLEYLLIALGCCASE